jgi:hypothetical protein
LHKIANNLFDPGSIKNIVYGGLANQIYWC